MGLVVINAQNLIKVLEVPDSLVYVFMANINRESFSGSLVDVLDGAAQRGEGAIKQWSSRPGRRSNWFYPDLSQASQRLASLLTERDIQPNDRVILWGSNSPQWVISYFGTLRTGAIVVPFDEKREVSFLSRVIEATQPRFIIAGETQRSQLPSPNSIPVINMEQVGYIAEIDSCQFDVGLTRADLAEIVFTSGTSGNPKGVELTHGNILSNVEGLKSAVKIDSHYKMLSVLPISHMFETTVGLLTPIASGSTIVYTETIQELASAMREEQITHMVVVPHILSLFKRRMEERVAQQGKKKIFNSMTKISPHLPYVVRQILFHSVHEQMGGRFEFFISGGARLDSKVADFWENIGIKVLQGYGLTETSPIITCDNLSMNDHRYVGLPLLGVRIKIAPDDEILVSGPNIMRGYWNNPAATSEVLEDGWFHTRDLGALEEGKLKLMGRKGNMIVLSNGLNVYPEDLEEVLVQQGVREAVVFLQQRVAKGVQHEDLHAILLLDDPNMDPQYLVKAANRILASHLRINSWTIWDGEDFPRTHTQKAKRDEIIECILNKKGVD